MPPVPMRPSTAEALAMELRLTELLGPARRSAPRGRGWLVRRLNSGNIQDWVSLVIVTSGRFRVTLGWAVDWYSDEPPERLDAILADVRRWEGR